MKNYFCFLFGFILVFSSILFFSYQSSANQSDCSVYFNGRSQTVIAYSCPGKSPVVIPGNEDVVEIVSRKIIPLLPFYILKKHPSEVSSNPSVITFGGR
ncbi:MAG: hypothetical protein P4L42_14865 [Desulfocapsaceae bacterium]|nr:hypothetical protein [Desulfocapsaceae bacterium]